MNELIGMDNKIIFMLIKFEHDNQEVTEITFDLRNPDDIDKMASYMKDYHTTKITTLTEKEFKDAPFH